MASKDLCDLATVQLFNVKWSLAPVVGTFCSLCLDTNPLYPPLSLVSSLIILPISLYTCPLSESLLWCLRVWVSALPRCSHNTLNHIFSTANAVLQFTSLQPATNLLRSGREGKGRGHICLFHLTQCLAHGSLLVNGSKWMKIWIHEEMISTICSFTN